MSHEELVAWSKEILSENNVDYLDIKEIKGFNFDPHPYMIGTAHVAHASDNYGGMLGENAIHDLEATRGPSCYWKGENGDRGKRCRVPYSEHKHDNVAVMELKRDLTNKEAYDALVLLKEKFIEENIEGFAFLEHGFSIASPE